MYAFIRSSCITYAAIFFRSLRVNTLPLMCMKPDTCDGHERTSDAKQVLTSCFPPSEESVSHLDGAIETAGQCVQKGGLP